MHKFFLIIVLLFFSLPIYGMEKFINQKLNSEKLLIEADNIEYVATDNFYASGNVTLNYENYEITADQLQFLKNKKQINFINNFVLINNNILIKADQVSYNYEAKKGEVLNAYSKIDKFIIRGKDIKLLPDKIEIEQGELTTCTKNIPDYYVKSEWIELYPQAGGGLAFNNWLYFGSTPVFYLPTYIFSAKLFDSEEEKALTTPLPEFGYDGLNGYYVRENIGYFIANAFPGAVSFGYGANSQLFMGLRQNLSISNYHNFKFNFQINQAVSPQGGIYYALDFSRRKKAEKKDALFIEEVVTNFIPDANTAINRFLIKYTIKEQKTNTWVDYTPQIGFNIHDIGINLFDYDISINTNAGYLTEYKNDQAPRTKSSKINIDTLIGNTYDLGQHFSFNPTLKYFGNWYSNTNWQRVFVNFGFNYNDPICFIKPSINFLFKTLNVGSSPFNFDTVDAETDHEIGLKLNTNLNPLEVFFQGNYQLTKEKFRILDVNLKWLFHCWKLVAGYRIIQNQFLISAELY